MITSTEITTAIRSNPWTVIIGCLPTEISERDMDVLEGDSDTVITQNKLNDGRYYLVFRASRDLKMRTPTRYERRYI